jgi:pimeloyl-ACP methyl ester carboxylesterase
VIAERRMKVAGIATRVLETDGRASDHPVLLVHGNPTSADMWRPFLDELEGKRACVAPDLPGWGESQRVRGFRHTMLHLATYLEELLDARGVRRFDLVVHDWGGVGLIVAQRRPADVGRVVVLNTVPLLPGYRWHWIARLWRKRVVGELLNATTNRWATRTLLRQSTPRREGLPELADLISRHFDRGTKRAVLELYRDADPERLEQAGRRLGEVRSPGLVVWGDHDPYIGVRFADEYARALGGEVRVEHLPDAGHWSWLDRPDVVHMVSDFLMEETREAAP